MKQIELTKEKSVLVDDSDYEWLNKFKWFALKAKHTYYAARSKKISGRRNSDIIFMHREILGLKKEDKIITDHEDGDGLNNQRYNLRKATKSQNAANKIKRGGFTSKYLGVWFTNEKNRKKRWVSVIMINYKAVHLGRFNDEIDAAKAYNLGAIKYHGEFANLNKV